jgi:hypothetical protein
MPCPVVFSNKRRSYRRYPELRHQVVRMAPLASGGIRSNGSRSDQAIRIVQTMLTVTVPTQMPPFVARQVNANTRFGCCLIL